MNNTVRSMAVCMAIAASVGMGLPFPRRRIKEIKNCLNCNNEHTHHNNYCSPECCKEDRITKKLNKIN